MFQRHIRHLVCLVLLVPLTGVCGDMRTLSRKSPEEFWGAWDKAYHAAAKCDSAQQMKVFLSNALQTLGSAEIDETNAEEIEKFAISNPSCLLAGAKLLSHSKQEKLIYFFLLHPLYHDPEEIEKPFQDIWAKGLFIELKAQFLKAKATANTAVNRDAPQAARPLP